MHDFLGAYTMPKTRDGYLTARRILEIDTAENGGTIKRNLRSLNSMVITKALVNLAVSKGYSWIVIGETLLIDCSLTNGSNFSTERFDENTFPYRP